MKYILIFLLLVSVRGFSQVTMSTLNNKIDSLSLSMDSTIFKQKIAPNAAYIVLDTLTLPQNSFGFFTIYYCSYDTAQKNTGEGMEEVFITRVGGAYSNPIINILVPYSSSGTTHQVTMAVTQIGGIILVRVDGYGVGDPIRWHEVRQAKISPL
jgi:hypothetical protein